MSKKTTVSLGNALDIMNVSGLKARLSSAMEKKLTVVLIADKIDKVDTAGIQLIYAFIKKIEQQDNTVVWQKPSDTLLQISETIGMREHLNLI